VRNLITFAMSVAMLGCATKPIPSDAAQVGRALAFQQQPASDYGTITVVRDAGYTGGMCAIELTVEGKPAAILEREEKVVLYLPVGRQTLGASFKGKGLCGAQTNNDRTRSDLEIQVENQDIRTYRISMSPDAGLNIRPAPIR